jgi:hypothetical protein
MSTEDREQYIRRLEAALDASHKETAVWKEMARGTRTRQTTPQPPTPHPPEPLTAAQAFAASRQLVSDRVAAAQVSDRFAHDHVAETVRAWQASAPTPGVGLFGRPRS